MSSKKPLVSIILPTYNRLKYLQRSIGSVLSQTYQNWELIIWNDGSSDGTGEFCQTYKDQRIRYFRHENHGMSYALNQAIERSRGEFVAFLDDDDQWLENKLELQFHIMSSKNEIDMVFGNFQNYYENEMLSGLGFDQTARAMSALKTQPIEPNVMMIRGGFLEGLARDNFIAFDSTMIRKLVVDSVGMFNEGLRNGMDLEYWWRFGLAGRKAAYTNIPLLNRFKYANSLSGRNVLSVCNHVKALDSCGNYSREYQREETLQFLEPAYRNAWQNMITACAMEKDSKGMMEAFKQSLKYGFRPGSLRLLIEGLLKIGVTR